MEHAIGTLITLEVVEIDIGKQHPCGGCFFKDISCLDYVCGKEYRTDGKNIIYKEVTEDKQCESI